MSEYSSVVALALAERIFHNKAGWALLTQYRLEILITSRLEKAIGEGVKLGAVGPEIRLPYPI